MDQIKTLNDLAVALESSPEQLKYLLYGIPAAQRYSEFKISKKRGGSRRILAPRTELKIIQRRLSELLYEEFTPRKAAHGFCRDRSIVSNAKRHVRRRYVFNVDLKDFFISINFGRIRGLFLDDSFGLSPKVATVMAQLVCHENQLPQGAPTSPIISNMICVKLDGQLTSLASKHGCTYSRYADDLTFSRNGSDFPQPIGYVSEDGSAVVGEGLRLVIEANGFKPNIEKVHLQPNKRRQSVTGLVVNGKVNVQRRYVRQIRAMIHACAKYGEKAATKEHLEKYYRRTNSQSRPRSIYDVISGKLEFMRMVKGFDDPVCRNLGKRFAKVNPDYVDVMKRINSKSDHRDIFISHATEDKKKVAKPLSDYLISKGYTVWYDEYEIFLGDSLSAKISEGLRNSDYGVVILSKAFSEKVWTQKELAGMYAREVGGKRDMIMPVWHGVSHSDILKYDPMLADKKAVETTVGITAVGDMIIDAVNAGRLRTT